MGRTAAIVYTEQREIDRLEQLVTHLPGDVHVRITDAEGRKFEGTVVERPAPQLFENAEGDEGFNAMLRLDDPTATEGTRYLWLGDIRNVEHLID